MKNTTSTWKSEFSALFERCARRYRMGDEDYTGYYTDDDLAFLASIGCKPREFFDFVEDLCDEGEPDMETALGIAEVRREYLMEVQGGIPSPHLVTEPELPPRDVELGGYRWLPRIIAKARCKLRGELDPDIMYACGGDRAFLSKYGLDAVEFLRAVWKAGDDDQGVLAWVEKEQQAGVRS